LDSRYGLCFRECLYLFIREGWKRRHRKKFPELHVVLESGHPNCGDAIRIFNETQTDLEAMGCHMLRTATGRRSPHPEALLPLRTAAPLDLVRHGRKTFGDRPQRCLRLKL
jgi:hypothetical protein